MGPDLLDICRPCFVNSGVKQNHPCSPGLGWSLVQGSIYSAAHCWGSVIVIIIINDGNNWQHGK